MSKYFCPACFSLFTDRNEAYPICAECDSEGMGIEILPLDRANGLVAKADEIRASIKKSDYLPSYRKLLLKRLEELVSSAK